METLKILLVEDSDSDIEACSSTIKKYKHQKKLDIDCVVAKSKQKALTLLDASYDGAIIDLKLEDDIAGTAGNDVIDEILATRRIPLMVFTGTPENVSVKSDFVKCFKKGEVGYDQMFDHLQEICRTGLTRILGGRGIIEKAMQDIFWNHLLPQLDTWKKYNAEGRETELSILRLVLNHLHELLNNDDNPSYPEETYIIPPLSDIIKTGSIVMNNGEEGKFHIVISPPCDLVIRKGGTCKTDRILIAEILPFDTVKEEALMGITKAEKRRSRMVELLKNNYTDYYHWLPRTSRYGGGFVNFRWITSVEKTVLAAEYGKPVAQLSVPFIKEVISRFSAFYARQGQPDLDFTELAEAYLTPKEG